MMRLKIGTKIKLNDNLDIYTLLIKLILIKKTKFNYKSSDICFVTVNYF